MSEQRTAYVAGLDLVRFASAMLVVFYHFGLASWASPDAVLTAPGLLYPLRHVTWFGWIGVEIFFVISGFVILQSARGRTAGAFVRHRAVRLYPAAWICATITAAVLLMRGADAVGAIALRWVNSVLLSPLGEKVDSPYWTLAVEMAFYAVVAVQLRVRPGASEGLLLGLAIWSAAYNVAACLFFPAAAVRWMWFLPLELSLLPYAAHFALGGVLWLGLGDRWTVRRLCCLAIAGVGALCETWLKALDNIAKFSPGESPFIPVCLLAIAVGAIWLLVRRNPAVARRVGPWGRTIGFATYPLYLIHNRVGLQVMALTAPFTGALGALLAAAAFCTGLAFAIVPLEKRLQGALRKALFDRPQHPTAQMEPLAR